MTTNAHLTAHMYVYVCMFHLHSPKNGKTSNSHFCNKYCKAKFYGKWLFVGPGKPGPQYEWHIVLKPPSAFGVCFIAAHACMLHHTVSATSASKQPTGPQTLMRTHKCRRLPLTLTLLEQASCTAPSAIVAHVPPAAPLRMI